MGIFSLLGNTNSLPDNLKNPFDPTKVDTISIYMGKSLFNDKFYFTGTVKFKNGHTSGEQRFDGGDIMDVVRQIYKFLEQL